MKSEKFDKMPLILVMCWTLKLGLCIISKFGVPFTHKLEAGGGKCRNNSSYTKLPTTLFGPKTISIIEFEAQG
jgi:hypothetical protein